jgi:AMMECR1 domain-containing protein
VEAKEARRVTPVLKALPRPLDRAARARLAERLRELLAFQRTLTRWPRAFAAPDATAFVSIYENGALRGCFASNDGAPHDRLRRAFLLAAHDGRFGGLAGGGHEDAIAVLSYPHAVQRLDPARALDRVELATHGLLYVKEDGAPVMLLPQVARDGRLDVAAFVDALRRKAGVDRLDAGRLFAFETCDVSSAPVARRSPSAERAAIDFLERLVGDDGRVTFSVDPRTGARHAIGPMHHGRVSVVVRALEAGGARPEIARRARRRLERDVERALGGRAVEGWPDRPDVVAGTLALCALAAVPVKDALARLAVDPAVARSPWHAAQVIAALGGAAPRSLFAACVADLDARPWAPWTLLASRAIGASDVRRRCRATVLASIRSSRPYRGGVVLRSVPEIALTALAIEAVAGEKGSAAAIARARDLLRRAQILSPRGPVTSDAVGAFPLTPTDDTLRCDVTAHAVLALLLA